MHRTTLTRLVGETLCCIQRAEQLVTCVGCGVEGIEPLTNIQSITIRL